MSSSVVYRWAGLAAIAGALFLIVGELMHPTATVANVSTSAWATSHLLLLLSLILGIGGVFGIYARQFRQIGVMGFMGFLIAFVAMASFVGLVYFEAFFNPFLVAEAPAVIEKLYSGAEPPGVLGIVLPLTGILFSLGSLLLGVATARGGVFPGTAGWLVAVGGVALGLEILLPPSIAPTVGKIAAVVFGAGFLWLGSALWSEKTERGATAT